MNLRKAQTGCPARPNDPAVKLLNARIDVRAVEGVESVVKERFEGFFCIGIVERFFKRMPGRKLPAAVDDAGAGIVGK